MKRIVLLLLFGAVFLSGCIVSPGSIAGPSCISDIDCLETQKCVEKECVKVECGECQFVTAHKCKAFECCDARDCFSKISGIYFEDVLCLDHLCSVDEREYKIEFDNHVFEKTVSDFVPEGIEITETLAVVGLSEAFCMEDYCKERFNRRKVFVSDSLPEKILVQNKDKKSYSLWELSE